jgi:hypothetical protein
MKWAIDEWMIRKPLSEVDDGIYIEAISYRFKKARISMGLLFLLSAHPPSVRIGPWGLHRLKLPPTILP